MTARWADGLRFRFDIHGPRTPWVGLHPTESSPPDVQKLHPCADQQAGSRRRKVGGSERRGPISPVIATNDRSAIGRKWIEHALWLAMTVLRRQLSVGCPETSPQIFCHE